MSEKLQKIGSITILGKEYDVAKNGSYCLVEIAGEDAYGHPIAQRRVLHAHHDLPDVAQALLDALGEKMVSLQGQRDLRRGEA